jgi:hypothetical protein
MLFIHRQQILRSQLQSDRPTVSEVKCRIPPRNLSSNWPYYQDNTVFGQDYRGLLDVSSPDEGEHPWQSEVRFIY